MRVMAERDIWEAALEARGRVLVMEEVTSTQDAAIAGGLKAGDVCVALLQTAPSMLSHGCVQ